MNMKKILSIFSLAGALIIGGLSFSSTITGAEIETPDQLVPYTYTGESSQVSQENEENTAVQQETVNSSVNNDAQQGTSAVSGTEAGTVSTNSNGTVTLEKAENKKKVSLDTVTVNGTSYNITTVGSGALKDASNVKTIELGANIDRIEKKAFAGAENLKKIKVNGTKAFRIAKGAFGKLDTSKMKVVVSSEMSTREYNKLQVRMRNAGFKGTFSREE